MYDGSGREGLRVWKYFLDSPSGKRVQISVPRGMRVLHFEPAHPGSLATFTPPRPPMVWCLVDPNEHKEDRIFGWFETGQGVPEGWDYVGTTGQHENACAYILHCFLSPPGWVDP